MGISYYSKVFGLIQYDFLKIDILHGLHPTRDPAFLLRKQKLVERCTDFNNLSPEAQGLNLISFMIDCMYL